MLKLHTEERDLANETLNLVPVEAPADLEALERHEVSEVFGDMDVEEWEDFLREFTANPLPEFLIIILYDGKVLDGWHRLHAAIVTKNAHLLEFREYRGVRPGMIANFANANRRSLESSKRSAAVIRNYRYDRNLNGRAKGDTNERYPVDRLADSAGVSTRQMRRALNAERSGLTEYVLSGEITVEDGEQIAKLGLAEKVRSGEMTIGDASRIVRERRVERRRPKGPDTPDADDGLPGQDVSAEPEPARPEANDTVPADEPASAPPAARESSAASDGAAEMDQVQEKYHRLRQDYDALYTDHLALKDKAQETEEKLTSVTRRWRDSMAECDALKVRVRELEEVAGLAEPDEERGPVPESA